MAEPSSTLAPGASAAQAGMAGLSAGGGATALPLAPASIQGAPAGPSVLGTLVPVTGQLIQGNSLPVNGLYPTASVYDPRTGDTYVAALDSDLGGGEGTLTVISGATNTAIDTIDVGVSPWALTYDSGKSEVFAYDSYLGSCEGDLVAVSDVTNQVTADIPIGCLGSGLAYDSARGEIFAGAQVWTASGWADVVAVVSDQTDSVVATISFPSLPEAIAYDPIQGEVFVTASASPDITVINDSTNRVTATIPVAEGCGPAIFDPGTDEIFADTGSNLTVLSGSNNSVVATVPVYGALAYGAGLGDIFVAHASGRTNTVTTVSDSTDSVVTSVETPLSPYPGDSASFDTQTGELDITNFPTDAVVGLAEPGNSVEARVPVGAEPHSVALDTLRNELFVTSNSTNSVTVFNASTYAEIATVFVGTGPAGIAYDSAAGEVFVANPYSNNLSVISDRTNAVVATIPLSGFPAELAVDPDRNEVFVSDLEGGNVTVISAANLSVVATVPVGGAPLELAYDARQYEVFVANRGLNEIEAISAASNSVVSIIPTPSAPVGIAVDAGTGQLFVAASGSQQVYALSDTTDAVLRTIAVGSQPMGLAYDEAEGTILVANWGSGTVSVISDLSDGVIASLTVGSEPRAITYDASTGVAFCSNFLQGTISVLSPGPGATYPVTFREIGLVPGTLWSIGVNRTEVQSDGTGLVLSEPNGTFSYEVGVPVGYGISGSSGKLDVQGGPANATISFLPPPNKYVLEFAEEGLPSPVSWSATISFSHGADTVADTQSPTVVFEVENGTYNYSFTQPDPTLGLAPDPTNGTIVVHGANVSLGVRFLPGYEVTFYEWNLPFGSRWYLNLSDNVSFESVVTNTSGPLTTDLPNGSYSYVAGSSNSLWRASNGSVVVSGSDLGVAVVYVFQRFPVTLQETGLPLSVLERFGWSAELNGTVKHSTTTTIYFSNLAAGSYPTLVTGPSRFVVQAGLPPTLVSAATTVPVAFVPGRTLGLTVSEHGLPRDQRWCVLLESQPECSSTGLVRIANLTPGNYTYSVGSPTAGQTITARLGHALVPPAGGFDLRKSEVLALTFLFLYRVTFTDTGLSEGTWTVTIAGHQAAAPWNQTIQVNLPNGTFPYKVSPVKNYTSSGSPKRVVVAGAAVSISVTFHRKGAAPTGLESALASAGPRSRVGFAGPRRGR